ncbi:uncharacterized protein LOC135843341 [Planococcus citri]|uniref:uncharacterized protein LOC135843341 n=1 Tax=Planococcus citri TaxID=170843 RepID=UPI0031FA2916
METESDELFKKDKDVCIVCGYVSANEFFSFPSDIDTRQKWAAFCDLPFDMIKPDFRLCDQHFRIGDYSISIQLIPTSVPSRQPKGKHGCAPSINNSLQSGLNSINISNPTVNKNESKNAIYCSPVFQSNTATDASNKQFHKDFKDITSNYDDDVLPKAKKLTLKRKLKDEQSRQQTKCFRSEISRLRTRCSRLEDTVAEFTKRIEQLEERCFDATASTEITGNVTEVTCKANLPMFSEVECIDSLSNADAAWPEDHSKKVALVESIEKVAEDGDGYSTESSMPPLEISNDAVHILDESLEQFSDEGCSRYSTQDSLAEFIEEVTEDYCSAESFMLPLEISSDDGLHNSEEQLEQLPDEVELVETSQSIVKDVRKTNLSIFLREKSNDSRDMNATPEQKTEGDPTSIDSQNCLPDLTKATDDVNALDDDEIGNGISVSPHINHQLSDIAASSNNEQFDKAHVRQTLRVELVRVTTQQPNCNDELNASQHNRQASPSARCSKRRKNGGESRITRSPGSPKKKKDLPSVATTIPTSDSVPKKVRGALIQDSTAYCCDVCDKTFSVKRCWTRHQQSHLKLFQCQKCDKRFARKYHLNRHQTTHTETRPYKCDICDARFKNNYDKLRHQRRMHCHLFRVRYLWQTVYP